MRRSAFVVLAAALCLSSAALAQTAAETEARRAEQAQPRTPVNFDPRDFDKFVGTYQIGASTIATVSRDSTLFTIHLTGQGSVQLFAESPTKFFATAAAFQISFNSDAAGKVTELVAHQNGEEIHARRIDPAAATAIEEALAARVAGNTPSPGTEASLRRYIDSLEKGAPNYDEMAPEMADAVRRQWPALQARIRQWGALVSLTFTGVRPTGMDAYDAKFERGEAEWVIAPLSADGKVTGRGVRPLP